MAPSTRHPRAEGPAEVWTDKHGYYDGDYWAEVDPEHQLGFVEGYLDCVAHLLGSPARFSRAASWYRDRISQWYAADAGTYRHTEEKIANVLDRLKD
jgi:hypothetical protein